ncbi:MAG TPA: histidine phosphatase family protein [Acidimicrobiales bacterium]|nr:histidine phosphatase family protein [Acidimicrobiales bacterium]
MASRHSAGPAVALLVRHGTTASTGKVLPGRAPGLHLSDSGRLQAGRAAERIAALGKPPTAVYASPLERTVETARPIAKAIGCRVRIERGLVECDVGQWTGARLSTLRRRAEWRAVINTPSTFRFPGGESFAEMQLRMASTLDRLAERHAGERIVVVSHADPIKAAVAATAGVPMDLFQRLVVSPCSVTALMRGAGAMYVLCVNATASLSELVLS